MRDIRTASRSSCSVKRRAAGGSSIAPSRRVSAAARIEATGVFSSCEAFATKSRRIAVRRRASVTSLTTSRIAPSVSTGSAVARSHRLGEPTSTSARDTLAESFAASTARCRPNGYRSIARSGTVPNRSDSARFA